MWLWLMDGGRNGKRGHGHHMAKLTIGVKDWEGSMLDMNSFLSSMSIMEPRFHLCKRSPASNAIRNSFPRLCLESCDPLFSMNPRPHFTCDNHLLGDACSGTHLPTVDCALTFDWASSQACGLDSYLAKTYLILGIRDAPITQSCSPSIQAIRDRQRSLFHQPCPVQRQS